MLAFLSRHSACGGQNQNRILLGYASLSPEELERGIALLKSVLEEDGRGSSQMPAFGV